MIEEEYLRALEKVFTEFLKEKIPDAEMIRVGVEGKPNGYGYIVHKAFTPRMVKIFLDFEIEDFRVKALGNEKIKIEFLIKRTFNDLLFEDLESTTDGEFTLSDLISIQYTSSPASLNSDEEDLEE